VPTLLRDLLAKAYAPTMAGVSLIALAAAACNHFLARKPLEFVLLLLMTMAVLFVYGMLFVIEKDDKNLAWAKVKGLLSVR